MKYATIRPKIQTGDCILWSGSEPFSKAIQFVSRSIYSHASIVLCMETRNWVVEACSDGVHLELLSEKLFREHGRAFWLPMNATVVQQNTIKEYALILCENNTQYDWKSIWRFFWKLPVVIDVDRAFCSELVAACWNKAGLVDWKSAPKPGDIPVLLKRTPLEFEL